MKEERHYRIRVVIIFVPLALGFVGWVNVELIADYFYISPRLILLGSGYLIALGVGTILMLYLRGGVNLPFVDTFRLTSRSGFETRFDQSSKLERSVRRLEEKVSRLEQSQASLKEGQVDEVVESLRGAINENLLASLEERFSNKAAAIKQLELASDTYKVASSRLEEEISTLSRRANLNLVIGVLTTAAAVGLLIYMVLGTEQFPRDLTGLLSYYIPRVTIVIFVEIFSYFFLKLYKSNLAEIKYYQSKITDIYRHQVAHSVAVSSDEESLRKEFLSASLNSGAEERRLTSSSSEKQITQLASMIEGISKTITNLSKK